LEYRHAISDGCCSYIHTDLYADAIANVYANAYTHTYSHCHTYFCTYNHAIPAAATSPDSGSYYTGIRAAGCTVR